VGVAASAGGPAAIVAVLGALPAEFPGCIALVQHLPPGFAAAFAAYLRQQTALTVEVVQQRAGPRPGVVLLAGDDRHLVAAPDGHFEASDAAPVGGHRPSGTVLLASLARVFGAEAIGVVLSGIGEDGAQGLCALRAAGALTIAQSEETSLVYGMPRAAALAGGASTVLPLSLIAAALQRWDGAAPHRTGAP
jgi:two-component system chemotaxis response regulator CheB